MDVTRFAAAVVAATLLAAPAMAEGFSGRYGGLSFGAISGSALTNDDGPRFGQRIVSISGSDRDVHAGITRRTGELVQGYEFERIATGASGFNTETGVFGGSTIRSERTATFERLSVASARFGVVRDGWLLSAAPGVVWGEGSTTNAEFNVTAGSYDFPPDTAEFGKMGFALGVSAERMVFGNVSLGVAVQYFDFGLLSRMLRKESTYSQSESLGRVSMRLTWWFDP
jgi:opacity protein-like surface antigen